VIPASAWTFFGIPIAREENAGAVKKGRAGGVVGT